MVLVIETTILSVRKAVLSQTLKGTKYCNAIGDKFDNMECEKHEVRNTLVMDFKNKDYLTLMYTNKI